MKVEPLLKHLGHRRVAGDVRGGAQLHRGIVGDDEDVARLGNEERTEAGVARNLLQVGPAQLARPDAVLATR